MQIRPSRRSHLNAMRRQYCMQRKSRRLTSGPATNVNHMGRIALNKKRRRFGYEDNNPMAQNSLTSSSILYTSRKSKRNHYSVECAKKKMILISDCNTLAQKEKERNVLEPFKGLYVSERGYNTAVSGMNLPHGPSI